MLRDAHGNSIASGGNNRRIVGPELIDSLQLASAAPDLLDALRSAADWLSGLNSNYGSREVDAIIEQCKAAIGKATEV